MSVLFADLVGFTPAAHEETPENVVAYLDGCVREFELLCERHRLEKIKTIGDAFMFVGGIHGESAEQAIAVGRLALDLIVAQASLPPLGRHKLVLRIGIHHGAAIAGVIGDTRISYDLWGDAVNVASRMESHGVPGRIHVSEAYRNKVQSHFDFEERGETAIKGIGTARTYFLVRAR